MKLRQESSVENTASSSNQPQSTADIFDLPANATKGQIRAAYLKAIKKYHPDNFAGFSPEFQKLAEEKSKQ
ncbi:MAG TPA: J domain-containing protein, partial [Syntrophobacteraceae bacterium]|nr:J domain-containing protein [Syntrophobacteraceae bacterium]